MITDWFMPRNCWRRNPSAFLRYAMKVVSIILVTSINRSKNLPEKALRNTVRNCDQCLSSINSNTADSFSNKKPADTNTNGNFQTNHSKPNNYLLFNTMTALSTTLVFSILAFVPFDL